MRMRKHRYSWSGSVDVSVCTEDGETHDVVVNLSGYFKDAQYDGPPERWEPWDGDYTFNVEGEHTEEILDLVEEQVKRHWQTWVAEGEKDAE